MSSETTGSPFAALAKMYGDGVNENDKRGYADSFFNCFNIFSMAFKKDGFRFTDIEFLDGYFLFGMGTNSVVHFHIDECPGWKFGIWWEMPEKDNSDLICGQFFAQYEETIDKFKPSHSQLHARLFVNAKLDDADTWESKKIVEFIKNEPHLAFCRDYHYWDYNHEYHTREEAERVFAEYVTKRDNKNKYTAIADEKILNFVREKILPMFVDAEIVDRGDCWSPRYEVIAPYKPNKESAREGPGWYGWFCDNEDGDALKAEYESLERECEAYGDEYEFMYFPPISRDVCFID